MAALLTYIFEEPLNVCESDEPLIVIFKKFVPSVPVGAVVVTPYDAPTPPEATSVNAPSFLIVTVGFLPLISTLDDACVISPPFTGIDFMIGI